MSASHKTDGLHSPEAKKDYMPMQPDDVYQTYADSSTLGEATSFKPNTPL